MNLSMLVLYARYVHEKKINLKDALSSFSSTFVFFSLRLRPRSTHGHKVWNSATDVETETQSLCLAIQHQLHSNWDFVIACIIQCSKDSQDRKCSLIFTLRTEPHRLKESERISRLWLQNQHVPGLCRSVCRLLRIGRIPNGAHTCV